MVLQEISTFMAPLEVISRRVLSIGRVQLDLLVKSVRSWTSRSCGRQTERATCNYRKVASSSLSRLVAHFWVFRLFMKGKFDAYVL